MTRFRPTLAGGATLLHAEARFAGPDTLLLDGKRLQAGTIAIATGAIPRPLGISGEKLLLHADGFMDLEELPPGIVFQPSLPRPRRASGTGRKPYGHWPDIIHAHGTRVSGTDSAEAANRPAVSRRER